MPTQRPHRRPVIAAPEPVRPLIELLRRDLAPIDIWLFGSRARGDHQPDSDWDILAVLPDDAPDEKLDRLNAYFLARNSGVDATLLVSRKSDIEGLWDVVNTMGDVLAHEGVRLELSGHRYTPNPHAFA